MSPKADAAHRQIEQTVHIEQTIVLVPGRSSGASRSKSRLKSQSKSQAGGANGTSVRGRKTSSAGI